MLVDAIDDKQVSKSAFIYIALFKTWNYGVFHRITANKNQNKDLKQILLHNLSVILTQTNVK